MAVAKPTLYMFRGNASSNAWRAHITLLEKGVEFNTKYLDPMKKEHKAPEYLAINPYGQVPSYVEGNLALAESVAIMMYLDKRYPQNPLMPSDVNQAGLAYMRLIQVSEKMWDTFKIVFPVVYLGKKKGGWQPPRVDSCTRKTARILGYISSKQEKILGGRCSNSARYLTVSCRCIQCWLGN